MEDKLYCVSLNEFIRIATGWLYSLAPSHKPRFINEIVDEMIVRFKRDAQHIGDDFFYHEVNGAFELRVLVEDFLMPIKQFRDLNLSKREYGLGIDVDDPNRQELVFVSRYSSIPEEEDFIDLEACIMNIVSDLKRIQNESITMISVDEFKNRRKKIYEETPEQEKTNIICPKCGKALYRYNGVVFSSIPPQYRYSCECGFTTVM